MSLSVKSSASASTCPCGMPNAEAYATRLSADQTELIRRLRELPEEIVAAWDARKHDPESTLVVYQYDGVPAVGLAWIGDQFGATKSARAWGFSQQTGPLLPTCFPRARCPASGSRVSLGSTASPRPPWPASAPLPSRRPQWPDFRSPRSKMASDQRDVTRGFRMPSYEAVDEGRLVLPEFQRDFDWTDERVRALLATVIRRWPAGSRSPCTPSRGTPSTSSASLSAATTSRHD